METKILESLKNRRTYYQLDKNIKVEKEEIVKLVRDLVKYVPDAMNMHSQRVAILFDEEHDKLWDLVYDTYEGKVPREKTDGFKAGAGTILFFYDGNIIDEKKEQLPTYKDKFEEWANHSNGMLQISVWSALEELGLGVNLQHYNPFIDDELKKHLNIDKNYKLLAQMVFGNKTAPAMDKELESEKELDSRVVVFRD